MQNQKEQEQFISIMGDEEYTANMGFSAMLADEHILIDKSLSTALWCELSSQHL